MMVFGPTAFTMQPIRTTPLRDHLLHIINAMRISQLLALAGIVVSFLAGVAGAQPAEQAEQASLEVLIAQNPLQPGSATTLDVKLTIKPGLHAQSHAPKDANLIKFEVKLDPNDDFTAGEPVYPPGKDETYEALGTLNVYTGTVNVTVPITLKPNAPPGATKLTGSVRYQICDDQVCYMPVRTKFSVDMTIAAGPSTAPAVGPTSSLAMPSDGVMSATQTSANQSSPDSSNPTSPESGADTAASPSAPGNSAMFRLEGADWSATHAFGIAFLVGLIFNVMPCVLPVLPLKAMGFYEVSQHHRGKCFALGVVFSLGVIALFGVLAVVVLALKVITWGGLFSKAWFVWTIVILLTGMALSMFGAFTFQLPTAAYAFTPRHDTYSGNFLLGGFTAILATPCTAPLLPPLLIWASAQPSWIGVSAMLVVGVGMASPYLVLSAFPQFARKFPRTGPWSELFKQMMGFMLLVAAAYFAGGRLFDGTDFWWLVVAMTAVASIFLIARIVQLSKNALPVAIGAVLAVTMLGGTLWWTLRITGALSGGNASSSIRAESWQPFTRDAFDTARATGRPVLVKFTANWCATCQVIEGTVFTENRVWDALAAGNVVTLKADLTDENAEAQALLLTLNPAGGIPLTAIFKGEANPPIVLSSVYDSETLINALEMLK